jgi:hypothetical protein
VLPSWGQMRAANIGQWYGFLRVMVQFPTIYICNGASTMLTSKMAAKATLKNGNKSNIKKQQQKRQ